MTDRELLEMAAKAIEAELHFATGGGHPPSPWLRTPGRDFYWNPLSDDGDAMRLAARLELDVMHRVVGGKRIEVLAAGGPLIQEFYEGAPYAATRRAIVRAAAEVSRKRATKETA